MTAKCLSAEKKSLVQGDDVNPSGLLLLAAKSQVENRPSTKSEDAQGKTSDRLDFILTCVNTSLWLVTYFCFGKKPCQPKI